MADRGVEAMAKTLRKPLPEDVDFMHASREEMASLRKAIYPLDPQAGRAPGPQAPPRPQGPARLPQHRAPLAQLRRRAGRAQVPYPRPSKPEIFVVADISGSVAAFARFTLHLVYAISGQFSKVRSFVFIDGIDEVTRFFEGVEDIAEAVHRVNTEADVVWVDGHSDYGHAFEVFWQRYGREIGPKTTVHDPRRRPEQLPRLARPGWSRRCARRPATSTGSTPSRAVYWDTGDSIVGEYGVHCDGAFECRNLRQLEKFVDYLAALRSASLPAGASPSG